MTQSGGVALALVEDSRRLGLGVSSFVSVGNKADISGNDLLQYWEDDPHTRVVLLYPVLVSAEGATILDARVRVEARAVPPPWPAIGAPPPRISP